MAQAWDAARTAMKANQAEHKRAADLSRHAKEHDFHEHDLVLVYRDAASAEDRHKFRLRWEGPYRIIRVQRPNLIVRLLDEDAPLKEVHMDKAKPYKEDIALPLHALDIAPRPRPNNELLQRARAERELLRRHESHIREPNDANLEVEDNDDDDDLDDDNDDDHEDNNEDDPFPELDPLPEPNAANAPQPGPAAQVQPPPARPPAGIPRRRRNPDDDDPDYDARRARYM
ncbi:hypothetical protein AAVH_14923 [Aphelenchoides avenae]|nr:hypothetical protein AAVH_14923 [Aphelenchus avenae]